MYNGCQNITNLYKMEKFLENKTFQTWNKKKQEI